MTRIETHFSIETDDPVSPKDIGQASNLMNGFRRVVDEQVDPMHKGFAPIRRIRGNALPRDDVEAGRVYILELAGNVAERITQLADELTTSCSSGSLVRVVPRSTRPTSSSPTSWTRCASPPRCIPVSHRPGMDRSHGFS